MHKSKGLSKRQQQSATLRTRYFNAQDDPLSLRRAMPPLSKTQPQQHMPIPLVSNGNQTQIMPPQDAQDEVNKREIDGFYLLEVSGTSFPEDLQHIVLSDRKLKTVVDEDLTYFSELQYVDVSENFLPLFPFGALPKLRELRIACNRIQKIEELFGFNQLMYLDMSYNQLQYHCIEFLYDLPLLKELDLSGNGLRHMPTDLFRFESLEKLILQYNKFDDNQLFRAFGTMPVLRCLDVSNNFFSSFPSEDMDDSYKYVFGRPRCDALAAAFDRSVRALTCPFPFSFFVCLDSWIRWISRSTSSATSPTSSASSSSIASRRFSSTVTLFSAPPVRIPCSSTSKTSSTKRTTIATRSTPPSATSTYASRRVSRPRQLPLATDRPLHCAVLSFLSFVVCH